MPAPTLGKPGRKRIHFPAECGCGCGAQTNPGRKYLSGHNARVDDRMKEALKANQVSKDDAALLAESFAGTTAMDLGYDTPCFVWTGQVNPVNQYPSVSRRGVKSTRHRMIYSILHPEVDLTGVDVHHKCGPGEMSRRCLNPAHLTATSITKHRRIHGPDQSCLTQEDVDEIREMRAQGWTLVDIADRFDITPGAVSNITLGRRWKDADAA